MVRALIYLQYHSIKNRTTRQFLRLKQPKYLLFCIVGGLYFYFFFFRRVFTGSDGQRANLGISLSPEHLMLFESLGALVLLLIILLAWIVPNQRAALAFTEAEVAFLFPAPISRRGLIHFKLLRSQTAIFFTTLLLTVVTNRFGGHGWSRAAGWWLVLSILNLHFLGASFARTRLLDRGITNWQRRAAIAGLVIACCGVVMMWARKTLPALEAWDVSNLEPLKDYVVQLLASGPLPYLLYPFRLILRPFLAPAFPEFVVTLGPALLLLVLHYWWVVRSDVAFEEASVEASKRMAEKIAAARAGNWQGTRSKQKGKRPPFRLKPTGAPSIALLWKNLISAGQAFSLRVWIALAAVGLGACVGLRQSSGGSSLALAIGMASGMLVFWSLLIGAQFVRQDLRQDLPMADILKTFPLKGWQIVLGELLAPAVILTGIQWFLLLVSIGLFAQATGGRPFGWPISLFLGLGVAVLCPLLNMMTLLIPNLAVLLFPAWFQTGKEGPHGFEATGQRLVFLLGQIVVFLLALIPAGGAFAVVLLLGQLIVSTPFALIAATLASAVVLVIEVALGILFLGRLFERFDIAAELKP